MTTKQQLKQPMILHMHQILAAFSRSDDERDFYLDRHEGFMLYFDLDKDQEMLDAFELELKNAPDRYCLISKLTFYETRKFMEGFVQEKVLDIDTKEKLLDIINNRDAKENFLEFIYDHLVELDRWQQFYQERSRVRIIEFLRRHEIRFVFEEDLDIAKRVIEKLKEQKFEGRVSKELQSARATLEAKADVYYSEEALNPRPKRGRPPKQIAKSSIEPDLSDNIFLTVPIAMRSFLFNPDYSSQAALFSSRFESEEQLLASMKGTVQAKVDTKLEVLSQRLESLRQLSQKMDLTQGVGSQEDRSIIASLSAEIKTAQEAPSSIAKLAGGIIPGKQSKADKKSIEALIEKKKKGVKKVTRITKNTKNIKNTKNKNE